MEKIYHSASSRIEAEAWINSVGKSRYPNINFSFEEKGGKWLVKKK